MIGSSFWIILILLVVYVFREREEQNKGERDVKQKGEVWVLWVGSHVNLLSFLIFHFFCFLLNKN